MKPLEYTVVKNNLHANDPRVKWCIENLYSLYEHRLVEFEINSSNKLIIRGDIVIPSCYEELPYKIDEIYGSIIIDNALDNSAGMFKSFKNFPDIVHGSLRCSGNKHLKSFEGCPRVIKGTFWCNHCSFSNLENFPERIDGSFLGYNNKIKDFSKLLETKIEGQIDISGNPGEYSNVIDELSKHHKIERV